MYGQVRPLGECLTNYVAPHWVAVGQPWPVLCSVTRVVRTSAHVTSYFVVTALVDSIRQRVLIIWDLLYSGLFPKALFCPHNEILIHVSLATKTGCTGEDNIWTGGTARDMENKN